MENNSLNEDTIQSYWEELKFSLDGDNFKRIFDDKRAPNPSEIVYIDEKDSYAIDFFKKQSSASGLDFEIKTISRAPSKEEIDLIAPKSGPIASVLIAEDPITSTPYISFSDSEAQLDSYASYFIVLGLLEEGGLRGLPEQIAGNLTYQIGHTMTLKATNRSYHLDVPAIPVYTSLVRAIGVSYGPNDEERRRRFLKLHITRSILNYIRQWENGPKHSSGLNLYPGKAKQNTLSYELPDTNSVSIAFNAMLYKSEIDIAHFIEAHTEEEGQVDVEGIVHTAKEWFDRAEKRKKAIKKVFWNRDLETYNDIDIESGSFTNTNRADVIYLLWAGVLDMSEAVGQLPFLRNRIKSGGFQYDSNVEFGEAPHQMLFWIGAERYKFNKLLLEATGNWLQAVDRHYSENGTFHSSYGLDDTAKTGDKGLYAWTLASRVFGESMNIKHQ